MKPKKLLVFHCSATREGQEFNVNDLRKMHKARGWSDVGYHLIVLLDGTIEFGRPLERNGAHVKGHNTDSLGVCYIGGLDADGKAKDTRTEAQKNSMWLIAEFFLTAYPSIKICGHRDLSPDLDGDGEVEPHEWLKQCPCFDVEDWLTEIKLKAEAHAEQDNVKNGLGALILHHYKPATGIEDGVKLRTMRQIARGAGVPNVWSDAKVLDALFASGFRPLKQTTPSNETIVWPVIEL